MITTKDIKIKDQAPEKLVILSTNIIQPKEFAIKGKGKPKSDQVITTSNIKEKEEKSLTANQEKIVAVIKEAQKETADLIKENEKLRAQLEKKDKEEIPAVGGEMLKTSNEGIEKKDKKKPWKDMTEAEMERRAAKGKATKARKEKEIPTGTKDSERDK